MAPISPNAMRRRIFAWRTKFGEIDPWEKQKFWQMTSSDYLDYNYILAQILDRYHIRTPITPFLVNSKGKM